MALSSAAIPKRILVTGANKGIGKAICQLLLEEHPEVHVLLGSRNEQRGRDAIAELKESIPGCDDRLELVQIDTTSDESVKQAAEQVGSDLYAIMNNAGIGFQHSVEDVVNVNYFGTRRVNDVFLPLLQRPGGRIVNQASAGGPNFVNYCMTEKVDEELGTKLANPLTQIGSIEELDKLARSSVGSVKSEKGYGFSKALVNAYTILHANEEKAAENSIIINSCTPGYIITDMTEGMGANNPPSKGAIPPVHLLLSPDFDTLPPGRYYGSDCVRSPINVYRGPGDPPYEPNDE